MKKVKFIYLLFLCFSLLSIATLQSQTTQQENFLQELRDYYDGVNNLSVNHSRAYRIYRELIQYSGMQFPILYSQNFNWGSAHSGGLIFLDYSSLNKPTEILAYIMSHEWAHEALGHQANIYKPTGSAFRFITTPTQLEDEADAYAGKFLRHFDYDIEPVINFLENLPPNAPMDWQHSDGRKRAQIVRNASNRGGGSITCPQCQGGGIVILTGPCRGCNGTGTLYCANCRGTGIVMDYFGNQFYCNVCGGYGLLRCVHCNGSGIISIQETCSRCNGKGEISNY